MSERIVYHLGERIAGHNVPTAVYLAQRGIEQCDWAFLWLSGVISRDALADLAIVRGRVPVVIAEDCDSDTTEDVGTILAKHGVGHYLRGCHDSESALAMADKIATHAAERISLAFVNDLTACLRAAESPAEERLAIHLCNELDLLADITPQAKIRALGKEYRADFLVRDNDKLSLLQLVIEVDGHDFHERTKEQAARDRSRDRAMLSEGFRVLRFTGSEVWNRPGECAREVRKLWEEQP